MACISQLPLEILESIFNYLKYQQEEDLKSCSLVCISWYSMIVSRYFHHGQDIWIKVHDYKCKVLLSDLMQYPTIGQKIKHITLCDEYDLWVDSNESFFDLEPGVLKSIVMLSPNIIELGFNLELGVDQCLDELNNPDTVLTALQAIKVWNLNKLSSSALATYLELNFRHRMTISAMRILLSDLLYSGEEPFKDYGSGLHKYISQFPHLKYLKIHCVMDSEDQVFDLEPLVSSCPKLEHLKIYSNDHGNDDKIHIRTQIADIKSLPTNDTMKKICLMDVCEINTKSLEYIMHGLNNLESLKIRSSNKGTELTSDINDPQLDVLDKFTSYCNGLKAVDVVVKNNNDDIIIMQVVDYENKYLLIASDSDSEVYNENLQYPDEYYDGYYSYEFDEDDIYDDDYDSEGYYGENEELDYYF